MHYIVVEYTMQIRGKLKSLCISRWDYETGSSRRRVAPDRWTGFRRRRWGSAIGV